MTSTLKSSSLKLNISTLSPSIYVVKVTAENGLKVETQKVIIE